MTGQELLGPIVAADLGSTNVATIKDQGGTPHPETRATGSYQIAISSFAPGAKDCSAGDRRVTSTTSTGALHDAPTTADDAAI